MSFLRTHRLHWGFHQNIAGNLHEHLDLMMKQEPDPAAPPQADSTPTTSLDVPTEMPSQIVSAPPFRQELGQ